MERKNVFHIQYIYKSSASTWKSERCFPNWRELTHGDAI